jgi:hypothetical protein
LTGSETYWLPHSDVAGDEFPQSPPLLPVSDAWRTRKREPGPKGHGTNLVPTSTTDLLLRQAQTRGHG